MKIITERIHVSSKGNCDMIDLTSKLQSLLADSDLSDGQMTLFISGSTASLSTVEYEPGLLQDVPDAMERLIPANITYKHDLTWHDGNGHSHVRATLMGPSLVIPFEKKQLTLGTWQQVIVLDFDARSRDREVVVQLMGI